MGTKCMHAKIIKRDGRQGDPQRTLFTRRPSTDIVWNNRSELSEAVNYDASETPGFEVAERQLAG